MNLNERDGSGMGETTQRIVVDGGSRHHAAGDAPQALSQDQRRFLLATASSTCALIVLDTNVVAVSLPSIARSFHAGFADVEWVVSAYMVAFASCLLPMGGLSDRYGRKKMMLVGLAVFALASLGCGVAPSAVLLDVARAVKGVGAAMLLTAALAVIASAFPQPSERARAWAVWGMTMGVATTVAPLVGGAITQWIGWRWIFLLNVPVCAVLAGCALRCVAESRNPGAGPTDVAGSALFAGGLALGIWALISSQNDGWTSLQTWLRVAACALSLGCFIRIERRRAHPMIDLSLFAQPKFVAAVLAMFGYAGCAQVMMTFLPLYLQNAFGWSAIDAGMGMLPFAVAMIGGPHVGSRLVSRLSGFALLAVGLALVGAGNLSTALAAAYGHYAVVAVGMVVTGLGAGMLNGETQKAIIGCVPDSRTGMASGISTTTRFTAIVMSVGVLGSVLSWRAQSSLDGQLRAAPELRPWAGPGFMSDLLAGDIAHASARVLPELRPALEHIAAASFASGFIAALVFAGLAALWIAVTVRWLSTPRGVDSGS
ncbi:hypothetical protein DFQ28_008821 [Apophysomyces sp. BC1034]|nr:hypothetical protein DFQ28_008821 [Apophysomyces sp. BC1034]